MLRKVRNIIVGWYKKLSKSNSDFAKERQHICRSCPHLEKFIGMQFCSICGCEVIAKSEVKDEICLDGRWPNVK